MVTANQKSIIDVYTLNTSKHNTKDSHQITREENKRGKEKKTNPPIYLAKHLCFEHACSLLCRS